MAMTLDKKIGKESKKIKVNNMRNNGRIRIATWNVRSTYSEGALKHLAHEMDRYNVHLLAIQETKQKGEFVNEVENYIFLNSGGNTRMLGVGFMKQHTKNVIDVRNYQGADADTDHFLVIATFKQSQNKKRKSDTREYHLIKLNGLQEPQIKEKYEKEVEKILAQTEQENIESRWKQIEDVMTEAAKKTIPQRKENQNWNGSTRNAESK
ncbi:hypothetical protein QE152_g25431 [Popillia japonica]|uniref:Craniofacial development protein 2 n=1 Tax=Popillia japonica TaxID=7064 RepID=A0AAW1K1Y3_POPJA